MAASSSVSSPRPDVITTQRGDVFALTGRALDRCKRAALRSADAVTVNSSATPQESVRIAGPLSTLERMPMGVPARAVDTRGAPVRTVKILYHHRTASKDGQNVHVEELIAALRRRGHDVQVVAPASSSQTAFGGCSRLVSRLKALLPRALYEVLELGYSLIAYHRLAGAIERERPDVLYERYNLFMLAGLWAARRYRIPFIVEVNAPLCEERARYDGLALKRLAAWSERAVWRAADVALPVTEQLANHLRAAGVGDERIEVVANGVDRAHFHPGNDRTAIRRELGLDNRLVLGFTGFIRTWHGLPRVLDAMAASERSDTHLLVVGDGPARAEIEARAKALALTDRLTIVGLVERDRIPVLTAAMDIALQPQAVDYASPLKLFEYLALARPVIAPDQPNIREILIHDVNALLFDPQSEGGFVEAIERLCRNDALRERLGQAAVRLIDERDLTWDSNARRIEHLARVLRGPEPVTTPLA